MSLRLNLFGFRLQELFDAVGSNDLRILQAAQNETSTVLRDDDSRSKSNAWLRTVICEGVPLKQHRPAPAVNENGGLLAMQMETEVHALAMFSLVRALGREKYHEFSANSSHWHHQAVLSLYDELSVCGFFKSGTSPVEFHRWISDLSRGTPLFGDEFQSDWAFYSILENDNVSKFLAVICAAATFERRLPEDLPDEVKNTVKRSLSGNAKSFIADLSQWFSLMERDGQDAFALWS